MGLFGFVKDVALLPIDFALDISGITPVGRAISLSDKDSPFGTAARLASLAKKM